MILRTSAVHSGGSLIVSLGRSLYDIGENSDGESRYRDALRYIAEEEGGSE